MCFAVQHTWPRFFKSETQQYAGRRGMEYRIEFVTSIVLPPTLLVNKGGGIMKIPLSFDYKLSREVDKLIMRWERQRCQQQRQILRARLRQLERFIPYHDPKRGVR